jgi:hypothetical protein
MKKQYQILVLIVTLALVTMACDIPFMTAKPAPFATPSPVSNQPTKTLPVLPTVIQASSTPSPESPSTQAVQQTSVPALLPVALDLATVILKINDFPPGFAELDATTQQQMGVTEETVASMFQGMFSEAKPSNYFAFLNAASASYQLVIGALISPLTQNEEAAFDQELNDPTQATKSFTSGLGINGEVIAGADGLGEKSIGFTFTAPANSITLRGDLLMVRRSNVVILVITMYQDGVTPDIDVISLASILDGRLKDALAH